MNGLLVLLDFDGVLFNSAYEAYQVCEEAVRNNQNFRQGVHFDEFMDFRSHLTDAWQFNRLYSKNHGIKDFSAIGQVEPAADDWAFSERFFSARKVLMHDPEWAKLMSPYPFFHQVKELINRDPGMFRILSTRNEASIRRTLEFYAVERVEVWGQESIRKHGSKLGVALKNGWLSDHTYSIYVDDMTSHLEPFHGHVNLCIHADWGYDKSGHDSYTETQAFNMIDGLIRVARGKK